VSRTAFRDANGVIYVSAALASPESTVAWVASRDNVPAVVICGHAYVDSRWLARAAPWVAWAVKLLEDMVDGET
jgi:hypothetical protein